MKKFLIYLLITLLSSLFFPLVAVAKGFEVNEYIPYTSLRVTREMTLEKAHSPYYLYGIKIDQGGDLTIEPGVQIIFHACSDLENYGKLTAVGTSVDRILISSDGSGFWWKLISDHSAIISLKYLTIEKFTGPIQIKSDIEYLGDIDLIDGIENNLVIGSEELLHEPRSNLLLENIRIMSYTVGVLYTRLGIETYGNRERLLLNNIRIMDGRTWEGRFPIYARIDLHGYQAYWSLTKVIFPGGCGARRGDSTGSLYADLNFYQDAYSCNRQRPLIFIPGYGTSINLNNLLTPGGGSPSDKWEIIPMLTPGYQKLFNDFSANGIKYYLATYDWRLPAERIVQDYLVPLIERVKYETGFDSVDLVCHSFGGIVARTYIQDTQYHKDVQNLLMLGTPNQGAAKAYGVWEGGVLPEDWAILEPFLRYYKYLVDKKASNMEILHKYFPSLLQMTPIYPALISNGEYLDPYEMYYPNQLLLYLRDTASLLSERSKVTVIASRSEPTLTRINLYKNPRNYTAYWKDGKPTEEQPEILVEGDGTVPFESVIMPIWEKEIEVSGSHAELPSIASEEIIKRLFPQKTPKSYTKTIKKARDFLWFLFDCPVEARITLPGAKSYITQFSVFPYSDEVARLSTDQLIWYVVPREVGDYKVEIRALEDSEVRYWTDNNTIHTVQMQKDQVDTLQYTISNNSERFNKIKSEFNVTAWGDWKDWGLLSEGDDEGDLGGGDYEDEELVEGEPLEESSGTFNDSLTDSLDLQISSTDLTVALDDSKDIILAPSPVYSQIKTPDFSKLNGLVGKYSYEVATISGRAYWGRIEGINTDSNVVLSNMALAIKPEESSDSKSSKESVASEKVNLIWSILAGISFIGVVIALWRRYRRLRL